MNYGQSRCQGIEQDIISQRKMLQQTLYRLVTFKSILSLGEEWSWATWHHFRVSDIESLLQFHVIQGNMLQAQLIWHRHGHGNLHPA